jgi:hypothetical protein
LSDPTRKKRTPPLNSRLWGKIKCRYCDNPFDVVVAIVPKHLTLFMCDECNEEYRHMIYRDYSRQIQVTEEEMRP